MPSPSTKKLITVKVTNVGATDHIVISNETQGWKKSVKSNAEGEITYNPANDSNTVADNDIINVYVNGRLTANGSGTVTKGGATITATATVDTISQAMNL